MKIVIKNSKLIFASKAEEIITELNIQLTNTNRMEFRPVYGDGTQEASGAFRGYYVDLTGLYKQGFRKVKFKATAKTPYVPGIVCTSPIPTDITTPDIVESAITPINVKNPDWFELPITENSKCLHANYCFDDTYVSGWEIWTPVNGDAKVSNYPVAEV